ncbi:hypothetical protein Trisim1_012468 [Trichoderma cf. simile WF8]
MSYRGTLSVAVHVRFYVFGSFLMNVAPPSKQFHHHSAKVKDENFRPNTEKLQHRAFSLPLLLLLHLLDTYSVFALIVFNIATLPYENRVESIDKASTRREGDGTGLPELTQDY